VEGFDVGEVVLSSAVLHALKGGVVVDDALAAGVINCCASPGASAVLGAPDCVDVGVRARHTVPTVVEVVGWRVMRSTNAVN